MHGLALRPAVLSPLPRWRLAAAALILGAAFAAAALLHNHPFATPLRGFGLGMTPAYPWWVSAATLALCVFGVAGAAGVLVNAPRAVAIGQTAASVLFLAAGVAAIADTGVIVINNGGVLDRTNLAVALLLLGFISAALALTFWSRLPRSAHPHK